MEEEVRDDSGIEDVSSIESAPGTITLDRQGSECEMDEEVNFLEEVNGEDSIIDNAVANLDSNKEPVIVMDRAGQPMVLQMPPGAVASEIFDRATDQDNVSDSDMYRYRLMHGDLIVDQEKSLAQQGVPPGAFLRLEDAMDVTVLGFDGRKYAVRTHSSTSVVDFRRELHRQSGIQPAEQRILFNGKTLSDGKKMSDYKVMHGASMQLVARCHSG